MAASCLHVLPLHVEDKMRHYWRLRAGPASSPTMFTFLAKQTSHRQTFAPALLLSWVPSLLCLVTCSPTFADFPLHLDSAFTFLSAVYCNVCFYGMVYTCQIVIPDGGLFLALEP